MNFEEKIKTTYTEVTDNFNVLLKNLVGIGKINYDAIEMSSKNLKSVEKV